MKSLLTEVEEIKIFILYLLEKIGYPLDYPSIGAIMMQDGIVNYFDFAEVFFGLVNAGLIKEIYADGTEVEKVAAADSPEIPPFDSDSLTDADGSDGQETLPAEGDEVPKKKLYVVSESGRKVAVGLGGSLMESVREKSYRSALRHLSFSKRGAVFERSFRYDGDGYIMDCSITDKDGTAMKLSLRADSKYQLDRMTATFDERPEVIFRGIVALMNGEVGYLFE